MQDCLYDALDPVRRQIRLLRLSRFGNGKDDTFDFELAIHSLADTPQYQASSYNWGNEDAVCSITINGHAFQVRRNPYEYLRLRRHESEQAWLYVDAICINQSDLDEKSTQVALMGDVYRDAIEVVAWLGTQSVKAEDSLDIHQNAELWQLYFDMAALSLVPEALEVPERRKIDLTLRLDSLGAWLDHDWTDGMWVRIYILAPITYAGQYSTLACDKFYGLYGIISRIGPVKVDYSDPESALLGTIELGLVEIHSKLTVDDDLQTWDLSAAQYICSVLNIMGEYLHSVAMTLRMEAICAKYDVDFGDVSRQWVAQGAALKTTPWTQVRFFGKAHARYLVDIKSPMLRKRTALLTKPYSRTDRPKSTVAEANMHPKVLEYRRADAWEASLSFNIF
ncbi:hypothetical protein B0A48_01919 [Cryoendolithus antarcticus]|uniref:Heterokaryon incompatibility domain-containing protein n=1 Tax=Cryoendolithus antarcticus TaxID=1507870 RepID=A0A1V8TQP3_9PEZI|nr:hypothetical protein B0A48_01919 [Cryoendolithus antarcticus]